MMKSLRFHQLIHHNSMTGDLILKPQPYPITGNTHKAISYNTTKSIFLSRKDGGAMETDLDMNNNFLVNVKDPTNSDHGTNKKYVDNLSNTKLDKLILKDVNLNNKQLKNLGYDINDLQKVSNSDLNMDEHRIVNSLDPVNGRDLTTKKYVDLNFLNRYTGGLMLGDIHMKGNTITDLKLPTEDNNAANKVYVDNEISKISSIDTSEFIKKDGSVPFSADLNMGGNNIKNLKTPTEDNDGSTKWYVDSTLANSHLTSSHGKNEFKYLNDPSETSSEYNIKIDAFTDFNESPHKNKKAFEITLQKDAGTNNYRSRMGFNLYPLPLGTYTIIFEYYFTENTNIQLSCQSTTAYVHKQVQKDFTDYSKLLVQINNNSKATPDYLFSQFMVLL